MKRIIRLFLVLLLTFSFSACSSSTVIDNQQNLKATSNSVSETPEEESFKYNPYCLPENGKEYLGDHLKDFNSVITALLNGDTQVILETIDSKKEFETLRRAVTIFYIPKNSLYDYRYYDGNGPFSFDEKTKTLTIGYSYSKENHIKANEEFAQIIEQIFNDNVTDINNKFQTAKELYLYVVNNTEYVLDPANLDTYEAFTLHKAYCQTYSKWNKLFKTIQFTD
ncbi:hypothetical protein SH2C18_25580 [Clostridium sediminicola]|uniref:hypothetical protein n=1 Tax=Clostridium sediminicola TaxID=3114879 RepID=UPI0031F1E98B